MGGLLPLAMGAGEVVKWPRSTLLPCGPRYVGMSTREQEVPLIRVIP